MIDALCRGKLSREQENLEDLLTSMVFGCLKHAPAADGILRWLPLARTLEDDLPLAKVCAAQQVTYEFWPGWQQPGCTFCEPDVVLSIEVSQTEKWLVCIEAKLWSGKSGDGDTNTDLPDDQLAKQWDNLSAIARENGQRPILIYLTANFGIPAFEIQSSLDHYRGKRTLASPPRIAWLSWRQLSELFANPSCSLLAELPRLCARLDLTDYSGIAPPLAELDLSWRFTLPEFNWVVFPADGTQWEFSRD